MRPGGRRLIVALALLPVLVIAACSTGTTTPAASPPVPPTISDAWVRPPLGPDRPAAGYMVITAAPGQIDALVTASSPVAGSVEIHETSADASGMMAMHPVHAIAVPAGSSVALEPGGYHLMLMDLTGELEPGSSVELKLEFESAGPVTVQAQVRGG